ncbi:hypothetical protein [Sphingomonas sp. SORGH_AS_0879]|uniref:hypothetical protein n=1 Tax=Sphingomonas sp. SORGH_AS_0879 TaxID=3041790 RepID=UPI0027D8F7BA|nr:hypothetical protein [Sphingomonas sp. SORGH_AS_0879]
MAPPPIKILRPGTFTDIHGTKVTFAQSDLDELIASYDAQSDPAPLVVGHPKIDAPAFGWVGRLAMEDGVLVAHPSEVAPAFAEAVQAGHYRKISPQLYPPSSPANPKPGRWYLQHVGFLGGAAPAIKGLGTVAFSDAPAGVVTLSIDDEDTMTDTTTEAVAFAERAAALDDRENAIRAREEEQAQREAERAQRERADRHATHVAFAEGLIADVKLAPAGRDKVVGLLDLLDASQPVSFGEGDANQMTPVAAFMSLFDGAQPVIALGEAAPRDRKPADAARPDEIARRARAYADAQAKAGKPITIQAAVRHVKAHPDA